MKISNILIILLSFYLMNLVFAEEDAISHKPVMRITVFPFEVFSELNKAAEASWWKVRNIITERNQFVVASKDFLIRKDVFQPRTTLKPEEVFILAKILQTDCILTGYLLRGVFYMIAYESQSGFPLWKNNLKLNSSFPLADQIASVTEKLTKDFLAHFPYQGFVLKDKMQKQAIYSQGSQSFLNADIGKRENVKVGDSIEIFRVLRSNFTPLFQNSSSNEIIATGEIVKIVGHEIKVKLANIKSDKNIEMYDLIKIPRIDELYKKENLITYDLSRLINPKYFTLEEARQKKIEKENKPLALSLTYIANLILMALFIL